MRAPQAPEHRRDLRRHPVAVHVPAAREPVDEAAPIGVGEAVPDLVRHRSQRVDHLAPVAAVGLSRRRSRLATRSTSSSRRTRSRRRSKAPRGQAGATAVRLRQQALARDREEPRREGLLAERQRDVDHRQPGAEQEHELVAAQRARRAPPTHGSASYLPLARSSASAPGGSAGARLPSASTTRSATTSRPERSATGAPVRRPRPRRPRRRRRAAARGRSGCGGAAGVGKQRPQVIAEQPPRGEVTHHDPVAGAARPAHEVARVARQRAHLLGRHVEPVVGIRRRVGDPAPRPPRGARSALPAAPPVVAAQQLGGEQRAARPGADDGDRRDVRLHAGRPSGRRSSSGHCPSFW